MQSKIKLKERKIVANYTDRITAYQIVKIGNFTFKLHCQKENSLCMGFNSDLCVMLISEDGSFKSLFDNRSLGLFGGIGNPDKNIIMLNECFDGFIKHLEELYC